MPATIGTLPREVNPALQEGVAQARPGNMVMRRLTASAIGEAVAACWPRSIGRLRDAGYERESRVQGVPVGKVRVMRDEVNEPLGFPLRPTAHPAERRSRAAVLPLAVAGLALAVSGLSLAFRVAPMVREPVVVGSAAAALPAPAPVAQSPAKPAAPPQTVANPPLESPVASADPVDAASGVKVARKAVISAAAPLIIDVQQALAEAKLRAALEARR